MVGFITPLNETYLMNYDEVNDFCESICLSDKYIERFKAFSKNYTYFLPYFDFIMFELDYIFINPLLEENTYLRKCGNALYKINKNVIEESVTYELIDDYSKRLKNGKNYPIIVSSSDFELKIGPIDKFKINDCMIDPNGYALMSTSDGEDYGNHEVTSNTILNQLLINNKDLYKTFPKNYSAMYLIEKFGFIRASSLNSDGIMIGVERFLTDKLKNIKNKYVEDKNCIFYDLETEVKIINDDIEKYEVRRR